MSTEHQQYSTSNQLDVVREYAARKGFELLRIYSDEGRSGLTIRGRSGMKEMIAAVTGGSADFEAILVYDVSRWGRFQNTDESAHYEYLCYIAGISVHYCAEQFENDGSAGSTIIKAVKREMAGEYSREQSKRVFRGACRLIELGYKQGGTAGYGLRRMLVDQNGSHKQLLARGEHKSIQTDRVILVPGPEDEVQTICWMYEAFVLRKMRESQIALELNERGLLSEQGGPWSRATVHEVLTNEKYAGNNVYHRTSCKLKGKHVKNPPEDWVRANDAFAAVIEHALFDAAAAIIAARNHRYDDDEMLFHLQNILDQRGTISGLLIDETEDAPSSGAYRSRFGSLLRAYQLIGYRPTLDYRFIATNQRLRALHPEIVSDVVREISANGSKIVLNPDSTLLRVNDEFSLSVVIVRCRQTSAGRLRWLIRIDAGLQPDITVAVRMDSTNEQILDYYLLPAIDITLDRLRMAEDNGIYLDAYRFDDLGFLYEMSGRLNIKAAA